MSTQVHPAVDKDQHQVLALSKEIQNLLEKGAIEPVDPHVQPGGFHSKYFLVRKKDGSFRPILDFRRLNKSLKCLPFCMLRIVDVRHAIESGMWFTSVDLKDAYFHIPIATTSQKVPSVHFSRQNLSVQSPSVRPVSFSQGVHMRHSVQSVSQSVCFLGMNLDSRAMRATLTVGRRQVLRGFLVRFQFHYKLPFISGSSLSLGAQTGLSVLPDQCGVRARLRLSVLPDQCGVRATVFVGCWTLSSHI